MVKSGSPMILRIILYAATPLSFAICTSTSSSNGVSAVAGKPRDAAAADFDRYGVCRRLIMLAAAESEDPRL